jgi:FeS assembly protein IscX
MKWTDVTAIAEALCEKYPDVDPASVRFVDLDGFDDDHARGGERVLEAIQAAWIEEAA